jgi:hypothetical protein
MTIGNNTILTKKFQKKYLFSSKFYCLQIYAQHDYDLQKLHIHPKMYN